MVQVFEDIEVLSEKLIALDNSFAFQDKNRFSKDDLFELDNMIGLLRDTEVFDLDFIISIVELVENEHLLEAVSFQELDVSDLTIDDGDPDNGDVGERISDMSHDRYEEILVNASHIIQKLSAKLERLVSIPENLY